MERHSGKEKYKICKIKVRKIKDAKDRARDLKYLQLLLLIKRTKIIEEKNI